MSADNWAECPRCKQNNEDAEAKVMQQYGKIPAEKYNKLLSAARAKRGRYLDPTLREDYEFYIKDGLLHAEYSGSCEECGLSVDFNKTQKVDI